MAKEPDLLPKPRGRPRADEPSERISSWLPVSEYDKIVRLAYKRDQSVSAMVRQLLALKLR